MVRRVTPNGKRIKALRADQSIELPQLRFAQICDTSERTLRRIENENLSIPALLLQKIAKALKTSVEEITLPSSDLKTTLQQDEATTLTRETPNNEKTVLIARHHQTMLGPVSTQQLYEAAEACPDIIPHILVDAPPAQMAMIKECLELLKAISDRQWSFDKAAIADVHDDADFPGVNRRSRLAELFVWLKGHDIRIVADREIYRCPSPLMPHLPSNSWRSQLVIAFAPPGEYGEENVWVLYDGGHDLLLPEKPIF